MGNGAQLALPSGLFGSQAETHRGAGSTDTEISSRGKVLAPQTPHFSSNMLDFTSQSVCPWQPIEAFNTQCCDTAEAQAKYGGLAE
jgi:hypothetical protein